MQASFRPVAASFLVALGFLLTSCGSDPCLNTDYKVVGQLAGPGSGTKFLTVPAGAADEQIKAVASSACGSRFCKLLIWEDSVAPARSLPLTEEQAASQLASYSHNPNTGSESLIIRGKEVPMGSCSNRES